MCTPITSYGTPCTLIRLPIGSRWPNSSFASFSLITTTRELASLSSRVNDRPGSTSPPDMNVHSGLRPRIGTSSSLTLPNSTGPLEPSSVTTWVMEGRSRMRPASSMVSGGMRRHGLISSDPSETLIPPEK